ncbi:MAG: hypothetical protein QOF15_4695 [Mycobacterium sp.]|nr:hypothetical protein [Mycobacterium sp.]
MADGARPALGLSIGATNLAAVTAEHAITRKPVLTLYRQRPPEVGVPSENPRLDEPGLVITDFVDRVGDRVGIVAADGSIHRSEALVADGLRALAYAATGGRALPDSVAVTYPAHWAPAAVDALGGAVSRVAEWSHSAKPLSLIPDAAAALFAVRANPGIPARGIVAVCDFGGSGTSVTLVDASGDYQPVAPTIRHHDFSGDLIDQSLLTYVMSEMPGTGSFDPTATAAIGSLARLRAACRTAKEQLSLTTVTTVAEAMPGTRGEIRLTRNELEETIRGSLDGVAQCLEQALRRNGIQTLVAIATVGGGASIPAVTTSLSGRFGVPVITTPRPQLTAAIGGALRAARGPGDSSATVLTPAPAVAAAAASLAPQPHGDLYQDFHADAPVSTMEPALAWSEAADESRVMPVVSSDESGRSGLTSARPQMKFEHEPRPEPEPKKKLPIPWYRLPSVIIISTTVAVLLVGTAIAIGLTSGRQPATKSPVVSTAPAAPSSSAPPPPPPSSETASVTPEPSPAPTPEPTTEAPPPPPRSTQPPPPRTTTEAPPPPTTNPPPVTTPPTTQPLPQLPGPLNPNPGQPNPPPGLPQLPQIPGLPQLPGLGVNVPGQP